jgi:hypothetical protein
MEERYRLSLTKREAMQLFSCLLLAENERPKLCFLRGRIDKVRPRERKKYWARHERLVQKVTAVIYNAGDCKIDKPVNKKGK